MDDLVSTEWLEQALEDPDLKLFDATWLLPDSGRNARREHEAGHIPGAVFLDLDDVADTASSLPHMMPPAAKFASRMQSLGARDGMRFVVYDNSPLHSAARAWWMLRSFGAHYVAILDGGLQRWTAEGRPLATGRTAVRHGHFTARLDEEAMIDKAEIARSLAGEGLQIVDARPAARFAGESPEPRPGLEAGHIPGSLNLPQSLLFEADNRWKRGEQLRAAFDAAGVDLDRPLVATCGSGITAAVLLFGAHLLGKGDLRLYDGSWSEWGADPALPKTRGER